MANSKVLFAELIEPLLPLLASAVSAYESTEPRLGNADSRQATGDIVPKPLYALRVSLMSLVDQHRAVSVFSYHTGKNVFVRQATLGCSRSHRQFAAYNHGAESTSALSVAVNVPSVPISDSSRNRFVQSLS